jgi:hypothetical protein
MITFPEHPPGGLVIHHEVGDSELTPEFISYPANRHHPPLFM